MSEFKKSKEELWFELAYFLNYHVRQMLATLVDWLLLRPFKFLFLKNLKSEHMDVDEKDFGDYQFETLLSEQIWKYRTLLGICRLSSKIGGVKSSFEAYPDLLVAPIGATVYCFKKQKQMFSYHVWGDVHPKGGRWVDFGWVSTFTDRSRFKIIEKICEDDKPVRIKCRWLEGEDVGKDFHLNRRPQSFDDLRDHIDFSIAPPPGWLLKAVAVGLLVWGAIDLLLKMYGMALPL